MSLRFRHVATNTPSKGLARWLLIAGFKMITVASRIAYHQQIIILACHRFPLEHYPSVLFPSLYWRQCWLKALLASSLYMPINSFKLADHLDLEEEAAISLRRGYCIFKLSPSENEPPRKLSEFTVHCPCAIPPTQLKMFSFKIRFLK